MQLVPELLGANVFAGPVDGDADIAVGAEDIHLEVGLHVELHIEGRDVKGPEDKVVKELSSMN